jgi:hypothetical protein
MERQEPAVTVRGVDHFPPELERLRTTATTVLHEHVEDDDGLCVVCRSAWPCERAQLAEHNLAVL